MTEAAAARLEGRLQGCGPTARRARSRRLCWRPWSSVGLSRSGTPFSRTSCPRPDSLLAYLPADA